MTDKSDTNKKNMLSSLKKTLGVVTLAADTCGISRDTHYRWLRSDDKYEKSVQEINEISLDFVESKLHEQINKGSIAAIIFYLRTKGKKRGFIQ